MRAPTANQPPQPSRSYKKGRFPLRLPDDKPAMTAAINWLCERDIAVKRTSEIHLKIGALNFYPDSGTLYFDGARKLSEHGLDGLKAVLGRLMPNTSRRDDIVEISIE